MEKLVDRIAADGITVVNIMPATPTDPPFAGTWYSVTLMFDGRLLSTPFGMGPALTGTPTVADVLNSLVSDAAGYENANGFEDWASEFGYDTDSRQAEATYRAVEESTEVLRSFLAEKYEDYLWDTEGL